MTFTNLKEVQIAPTAIELLKQQLLFTGMTWLDGGLDFAGKQNDTITLRLPAYGKANERVMRSATGVTMSELHERGIDVKLDTHIYHAIQLTDEVMTLDIESFAGQILSPQAEAVARHLESKVVTTATGATYQTELTVDPTDPRKFIRDARAALNKANVPMSDRWVALGADVENALLSDSTLERVDTSGSSSVLREGTIGRLYGFNLVSVPTLPVDTAIAFHRSAFTLATRTPVIPAGVSFGAAASSNGVAMRWIRDYADALLSDRSLVDMYCGTGIVTDIGTVGEDGVFEPAVDPNDEDAETVFVRAVKATLAGDEPDPNP